MKVNRFKQIVKAYGTREGNWPPDEHKAAKRLLATNTECLQLLHAQRELDDCLDAYRPRKSSVSNQRILENLPRSILDKLVNWLVPGIKQDLWRPAVACTVPLIIGILIGGSTSITGPGDDIVVDWQAEIYLLALDESSNLSELTNE